MSDVPMMYDLSNNERRPVTQKDVDEWQNLFDALGKIHMEFSQSDPEMPCYFKLKAYANKMRPGRYFVAEDKPLEPYPGIRGIDGGACYPSVPLGAISFGRDMPKDVADELVRRWNFYV